MAKIYRVDFQERELMDTELTKQPLLRRVGTAISKLTLVERYSPEDRQQMVEDAVRLNVAAYEIRKQYARPLSNVDVDEVNFVQQEASQAMEKLSAQEREGAVEQVLEITKESFTTTKEV